jgi:hypothetical protein
LALPARPRLGERVRRGSSTTSAAADSSWRRKISTEVTADTCRTTNVLETTFTTGRGAVRVTDALALPGHGLTPLREVARRIEGLRGTVRLRWRVEPRFGYGARTTRIARRGPLAVAASGADALAVCAWTPGASRSIAPRSAALSTWSKDAARSSRWPPLTPSRWSFPREPRIRAFIETRCWSERHQSYVRFADGDDLDAALLLMAVERYHDPRHPRIVVTIDAIRRELTRGRSCIGTPARTACAAARASFSRARSGSSRRWRCRHAGLLHVLFAGTTLVNVLLPTLHPRMGTPYSSARGARLLEPLGFILLNYGRATPAVTVPAHVAYGAIIGFLIGSAP